MSEAIQKKEEDLLVEHEKVIAKLEEKILAFDEQFTSKDELSEHGRQLLNKQAWEIFEFLHGTEVCRICGTIFHHEDEQEVMPYPKGEIYVCPPCLDATYDLMHNEEHFPQ